MWVSLGVYSFDSGVSTVSLSDDANEYVIADAIKLEYLALP
ncbi:MAG: golvesin C-terminal-like domain-containing protein [Candidatus Kariarchaeaceae archaeon]